MLFEHKSVGPLRNPLQQGHEGLALVERRILLAHEMHDHQSVLDLHALHAQTDGLPAQAHDVQQLLRGARQGTETVREAALEGLQSLLVLRRVEFAVEFQALGLLRNVGVGQRGLDLDVDVRVVDETHLVDDLLLPVAQARDVKPLGTQFGHRLVHDLLVGLETDVGDEPALLGTQQVARAADVEVLHSDVEPGTQVGELLDGPQTPPRIGRQEFVGRRKQVAVALLIRTPYAAAQLVQVAQTEVLGVVDDDRIGVGDVDAVLDDGRRHQHVELPVDEVHDEFFQLLGGHLAVPDGHAGLRAETRDQPLEGRQILDAVVDEIDLAAACEFGPDGVADDLLRENVRLGEDRLAVGRRGRDDGQIPRTHQRELQRTRNGRGGKRQRVDRNAHLGELLLGGDTEFLLLVDDQQPQIAEHDLLAQHLVRADQDVDPARGEILADLADLLRGFRAVDVLHPHREIAQTLGERTVVLQGKDRRGDQHGDLLAVDGGLERRADRHLGLSETHVAAHQPVHRLVGLHVLLDGRRGRLLVGGVLPAERSLQFVLQIAVVREGVPLRRLALGVEGDQFARNVLDGLLGGVLQLLPGAVAQFVDLRRLAVTRLVARNAVERMDVDEQHVAVLVNQLDRLLHTAVARGDLHQPVETPHPVVDVHHIVARAELVQLGDGHLLVAPDLAVDAVTLVTVENLVVGVEAQFQVVVHEALVQGRRQRPHDGLSAADLVENIFETLDLRLVLRKYIGIVAPQRVADHVIGQHLEILVEFRLRRCRELHRCDRRPLGKIVAQQENPASGKVGQQRIAARQQRVDLIGMLHVRERPAADVVDPP